MVHKNMDFNKTKELGGYYYLNTDNHDAKTPALPNQQERKDKYISNSKISECNITYLEKTIQLCKDQNIKVVLVRSPLHKKNEFAANEKRFQEIRNTRFKNIDFLDFKDFPLLESEYAGFSHVNYKGAKKFSIFFNGLLKNGLLDKQRKQEYINEEIFKMSKS
jgi:hypothetical protein